MSRKNKEYTKGEKRLLDVTEDVHYPLDGGGGLLVVESSLNKLDIEVCFLNNVNEINENDS